MQIELLNELVALVDKQAILKRLKALGYRNCTQSKKYRDFSLPTIFKGTEQSTEWVSNAFGDRQYKAYTFNDVVGAEQTEFVVLEVNSYNERKDLMRPLAMGIYFKEKNNGPDNKN